MKDRDRERIVQILGMSGLFDGVDPDRLHPVYRRFKRRDEISDTFDGRQYIGIIGSGQADVYTLADEMYQPNVSTQQAGSVFGICNVYTDQRMPTKLVCKSGCEVVLVPKEEFKKLVQEDSVFQERYLALCNQKIVYLARKIELMGITQSRAKLAFYLLQNADEEQTVIFATSKEQFAKFLNISRASLFRALAEFEEKGCIACEDNRVRILDAQALEQIRQGR